MPLSNAELGDILAEVVKDAKAQWSINKTMASNLDGSLAKVWMPDGADVEYKDLMRKARSPWLRYAARVQAQGLVVDGYSNSEVWERVWQASGMDGRQGALNEQVTGYGYGYVLTFPSDDDAGVLMRPLSVHTTYTWSEDPWSEFADIAIHQVSKKPEKWRVFDAEAMYEFEGDPSRPTDVVVTTHNAGVCPVTLIPAMFAMEGMPESPVVQGLSSYKRIVDATFTLQMLQRYAGFPQKWQSGGEVGVDEQGNALVRPSVDSLLHTDDPTARFGNFAAVDLNQAIAAVDKHIQDLAVSTQIPPHYLLGKVVNLSSDALAATETAYSRLVSTMRESAGEGYEQALRVGAAILGLGDASEELASEVHWHDTGVTALGSASDAVVKFDSVGVPSKYLLRFVPGMTKSEIEEAVSEMEGTGASAGEDEAAAFKAKFDALGVAVRAGATFESAAAVLGLSGIVYSGAVPVTLRLPEGDAAGLEGSAP